MWWGDGPDGWGWIWMGLMMAVVWLPLLLILVWALRQFGAPAQPSAGFPSGNAGGQAPPAPDAREIARQAYARGDMDRERYLQVIEDLDRTEAR